MEGVNRVVQRPALYADAVPSTDHCGDGPTFAGIYLLGIYIAYNSSCRMDSCAFTHKRIATCRFRRLQRRRSLKHLSMTTLQSISYVESTPSCRCLSARVGFHVCPPPHHSHEDLLARSLKPTICFCVRLCCKKCSKKTRKCIRCTRTASSCCSSMYVQSV